MGTKIEESARKAISRLLVLELVCKDAHYEAKGMNFRSVHMISDQMINGISGGLSLSEMRDNIQEIVMLGHGFHAASGKQIVEYASVKIKEPTDENVALLKAINEQILATLEAFTECLMADDATEGDKDLFATYCQELQHRNALLIKMF